MRVARSAATSLAPGWTRYDSINQVLDLAFAPDGRLWAATNGGLLHWEPRSGAYDRYDLRPSQLALAPDGTLWLTMDGGLWRFDGQAAELHRAPRALDGAIRSVVVTPDGSLWVATGRVVRSFDGNDWRDYPAVVGTNMLAPGTGGAVWAATHDGVARYSPADEGWAFYTEDDGLPGHNPHAISVSPDGQVWAYWPSEGLYAMGGSPEDLAWTRIEDPCATQLSDLAFATDGTAWASSAGSGHYPGACLAYYDGREWIQTAGEHQLFSTAALALGPSGEVAASTSQGIALYANGVWRLLRDGPTSDQVTAVAVTADGAAWFASGVQSPSTPGTGLSRFEGESWQYHLDGAEVTALAIAPDGALWAGVGCSVQRFDGEEWQTLTDCGQDLPPGNILDIDFASDGTAWVANGLALASYDGVSWTVYSKLANSIVVDPGAGEGPEAVWVSGWEGRENSMFIGRLAGGDWQQYAIADSYPGSFTASAVTPGGWLCGLNAGQGVACFDGSDWSSADAWTTHDEALGLDLGHSLGPPSSAPDGALWIVTPAGLLRWDAQREGRDAWTLYSPGSDQVLTRPGPLAFGPEGEVWIGATRFQP